MKICVIGNGAFGKKHLAALKCIEGAEVVCLVGAREEGTKKVADEFGVPTWTTSLEEALKMDFDAAIIASPTQIHAQQAIAVMEAGKHVMVEIPMADSLEDAQAIVDAQKRTGMIAMAGHDKKI